MMFCSWGGGGGGVAKGIRKFAFQLKAEVRFTQLQSIKLPTELSLKIQLWFQSVLLKYF